MIRLLSGTACTALLSFLLSGCGGDSSMHFDLAPVGGSVTYKGEPVGEGLIRFVPDEVNDKGLAPGKMAFSKIIDGAYTIPKDRGATVGKNRIEILSFRSTGRMIQEEETKSEEKVQSLPAQYNTNSTLSAEVKPGENTLDFDLE